MRSNTYSLNQSNANNEKGLERYAAKDEKTESSDDPDSDQTSEEQSENDSFRNTSEASFLYRSGLSVYLGSFDSGASELSVI